MFAIRLADGTPDNLQLSDEETSFLRLLLLLTGREDRLERIPPIDPKYVVTFRAILRSLLESTKTGVDEPAKCDLLNRLLLAIGVKTASPAFFNVVFHDVDFSKENQVEERVNRFRMLCMLEYGSFRYGYKRLKGGIGNGDQCLDKLWSKYWPDSTELSSRIAEYKKKPPSVGLIEIPPTQLFLLGYLASEQSKGVNEARNRVSALLSKAIAGDASNAEQFTELAKKEGIGDLSTVMGKAGVPGVEKLLAPLIYEPSTPYKRIMENIKDQCQAVDENVLADVQSKGKQNSITYLAMHDIDVYVAMSMREPLHFTNTYEFVKALFKHGELASWNLRYFDPTQSYVPERLEKGLIECLMIKRANVTIYNAQEADTFGKDAEAAVALAQGKPVVVYVARLFASDKRFNELYDVLDSAARAERDKLTIRLKEMKLLTDEEAIRLSAPESSKIDLVGYVSKRNSLDWLSSIATAQIEAELIREGYEPRPYIETRQLVEFAAEKVSLLERRALTFSDVHPLALQASPNDGVARGVIVTRSVEQTAKVLRGLLVGGLDMEIVEREENWRLVEQTTKSPVRVVTRDTLLTTAFWSEWADQGS